MHSEKGILQSDINFISKSVTEDLDNLSGKNILLTGGAGFLGYELSHLFSQVGETDKRDTIQLTIYDNLVRGSKKWLNILSHRTNVSLIRHDITKPIPDDAPDFDYIIHAASIASPIYYRKFPIETIDANVNGLRNLLEYAKKRDELGIPILGMLFFSTSEIYGDPSPDAIPTPETYRGFVSCTGPRACYDESKRLGETLCVNFAQQFDVPVKITRPFNNYGPGLSINDRRILPDLARDIMVKKDLMLLSDGKASRTFCYVADAICGYVKILVKGRSGDPYNIGTVTPEISILDFAEKVAEIGSQLFGYCGKVVYKTSKDTKYLVDNPNRRCPDISKANNKLGYNPQISIEEGIKRSLLWYRENQE